METGLVDIETLAKRQRINMHGKIMKENGTQLNKIINQETKKGWKERTRKIMNEMEIEESDINGSQEQIKNKVKEKSMKMFQEKINTEGQRKSKIKFLNNGTQQWKPGTRREYMEKLNREDASTIFKARTRMLDIKNNYRGKYGNNLCRACGLNEEDQKHVLEQCTSIHTTDEEKVTEEQIFEEDPQELRKTAGKIRKIMNKLEKSTAAPRAGNLDI